MKSIVIILLFLLVLTLPTPQSSNKNVVPASDFPLDPSKPYAYLVLDHVGPRQPLLDTEPKIGIWLRLKNNSRLPIVVLAVGNPPQDPKEAITLEDEIVPNPSSDGGDRSGGGLIAPRGFEEMTDIFRFPNSTERAVRSAEEIRKNSTKSPNRPLGYASRQGFDTLVITPILPGGDLYFSVPIDHVSKTWHFEIAFRLALTNQSQIRPPYSYLAFYQEDLDRAQGKAPAPTAR
jgi:hypothetical protein